MEENEEKIVSIGNVEAAEPKTEGPNWLEQITLLTEHVGRIANTLEFAVDNGLTVVTPADRAVASLRAQAHEMQMKLQAVEDSVKKGPEIVT
tara:strand:- start:32900 stop:33175 length:276 start_codon:yes stop_codon:yes gene_type:complete